jgi:hypothetical protein
VLALFAAEGAGIGASLGAQAGPANPAYLGLGAGVGLLTGIGYASLMPGREASLEPGDSFKITVGTLSYRPLAPSPPLALHPAPDPAKRTKEHDMSRARPLIALSVAAVLVSAGCNQREVVPAGDLPPAYTRDKILDPKLAEVSRAFTAWAGEQKVQASAVFSRVEVLPPAPTLLPYGIGTYQKQLRLPAILITGPGWRALAGDDREALAAVRSRSFPGFWNRAPARPPCRQRSRSRRRRGRSCAGSTNWSLKGSSCMETSNEHRHHRGIIKAAWADLLVLRPAFALAAAWLTTAGHTASFREMDAARGWVTAEVYA